MKPWCETHPGACSSRQTVGGRVLRRAVREGRPKFLWGGSSPVWCRYSHATYTKGVTSPFSSSCSPDQQRALLEPWERIGGVGRCLRTSAAPALAPFPGSLLRRLQCPAPVPVPPPVLRPTPLRQADSLTGNLGEAAAAAASAISGGATAGRQHR